VAQRFLPVLVAATALAAAGCSGSRKLGADTASASSSHGPATASAAAAPHGAAALPRLPKYINSLPSHPYLQVKPGMMVYTGDGSGLFAGNGKASRRPHYGRIRWTEWSTTIARGSGANWLSNCNPACGDGTRTPYPVRLKAYRTGSRSGHLVFTRMTVTYTHDMPPLNWARRTQTWVLTAVGGRFSWCIPRTAFSLGRSCSG
jgi:hypothetical protein